MSIEKLIINTLAKKSGLEDTEISRDSNFYDDLNLSQTEVMELFSEIEEKLSLEIPAEKLEEIETVQELVDILKDYMNELS